MQKAARFSVSYPTTILMMVLAILLLGAISFSRLGIDLLPDLNNPRLFVEVKSGDRPPEEMEYQFVTGIEALAARQRKVQNVSSVSRVGKAVITVEYAWNADMDEAFLDLQKSLAGYVQTDDDAEVNVTQFDPNSSPIMLVAFSHPVIDDLSELRKTAENIIRNDLIRLEGIAAVEIVGARNREVEIQTDQYTLEAYGLTIDELASRIRSFNRNVSGGSIVEMGVRYVIKGVGEFQSLDEIRNLIVAYKTGASQPASESESDRVPLYLRELASIDFTQSEPDNIVRVNGRRCLGIEIFKETKSNTIDAVEEVRDELDNLRGALPGYELSAIQDQGRFIRSSITEVEQTGLIGIVLAILVLYVFLRRVGVTAVISVAIPVSVVATFNLMYFNGLSLNIMTLGGLALGAGMLVDNAIVVMENIFRHLEEGKSLREAAVLGTGQVGGAITSSTLTTIVVFLPIVYLHGAAGELFREQAWTVAFSLISSLFVAILVIPVLSTRLLKPRYAAREKASIRFAWYGVLLEKVIENRGKAVLAGLILAIIAILMIPFVGSEFIPRSDQGEFRVNMSLPEGTSLERTAGAAQNIETILSDLLPEDIETIYTRVGPSTGSSDETSALEGENNAVISVILKRNRSVTTAQAVSSLNRRLKDIPEVEFEIVQQQTALQMTLGTNVSPLVVEIEGEDLDILDEIADSVKAELASVPDVMNVETSFEHGRPEVDIIIDRTQAAEFSLTVDRIAAQLQDILGGRDAGQIEQQGDYIDIRVSRPDVSVSEIAQTLLETTSGRRVALDEVARLEFTYAPREIVRNNQTRIGRITAQVSGSRAFDKIADDVESRISGLVLPSEYSYEVSGEEQKRREAFGNLGFALLLAVVLVYMVMAAQFESLIHPFVIILTLPLAGVGAVIALFLLNMQFNIMSYIGIIMLAGIAVNDSIILVDCINQLRRSGLTLRDAVIRAGQMRIRPIVMTSVTTVLALFPLTIGVGEGASLRAPMAVAVIGGLVTSTLLTLVIIPAVYHILAGKISPKGTSSDPHQLSDQ